MPTGVGNLGLWGAAHSAHEQSQSHYHYTGMVLVNIHHQTLFSDTQTPSFQGKCVTSFRPILLFLSSTAIGGPASKVGCTIPPR